VFAHWAQLTGDADLGKLAQRVFDFEQKTKVNPK